MTSRRRQKRVVLRDLVIFQIKLAIDGLKDVVLLPVSVGAALIDLIFPGPEPGRCFYTLLRAGERFDRWLSLYAPATHASAETGGLFGASRAGSDSLLGELESLVLGHDEPRGTPGAGGGQRRR